MQDSVVRLLAQVHGVRWGACLRVGGRSVAEVAPTEVLPTASVGKVLLLVEVARRLDAGLLDADRPLSPAPDDIVGDSGLWQHLGEAALSVESLSVLVASVSDNLATNVLLREVGIEAVDAVAVRCGLDDTRLLDRIRDRRGPEHPPAPSVGSAVELARLMAAVAGGEVVNPAVSTRMAGWLSLDVDTSMVAGGLGLDPLSHLDGPVRLFHKTGWDVGVRADVGHVVGPSGQVSYAVLAQWDPDADDASVDAPVEVMSAMRAIGELVRAEVA